MTRLVAVLAYAGMTAFEAAIAVEVLDLRWSDIALPDDWYDVVHCAEEPGPVPVRGRAELHVPHGLDTLAAAHTVVIPSVADPTAEPSPRLVAALRDAHRRGARIVSICSGVFPVAAAGLLDGLPATTHWRYADLLRRRYPAVRVDAAQLYVDNGRVLSSAGCVSGIDLCLHLVRTDFGATMANAIARRLVVPPHRDGGQAPYVEQLPAGPAAGPDDAIARSLAWAQAHLAEPITLDALAARAAMSPRTYLRHFARDVGTSPIKWLIARRVQASLPLLETTEAPIEHVASAVGFDSAVTYRHHFARAMATSPTQYRRTFRRAPDGELG
jgi:AraC family transcriptional activator FtrA